MNNIRVAGIDYEIQYLSSEEMNGNIGLADFNNQKIMINTGITEQTKRIALMHETLHILDKAYNLKLSEDQVTYTAHALIALAADNPGSGVL
jgi:Zn-dependent peptidase ImmA (M78 family)